MATARFVTEEETPAWNNLAIRRGELFQQPGWVDALGGHASRVGVYDSGKSLVAGFVVRESRRLGFRVLRNPPFCQSAGPFWEERATSTTGRLEERRRILEAMAAFLEPGCGVSFMALSGAAEDVLPFRWRAFKTAVEYTYRLPLGPPAAERLAGYAESRRRSIRKAEKDGLETEVTEDGREVATLQKEILEKEQTAGAALVPALFGAAQKFPGSFAIQVKRKDLVLAGCFVFVWDGSAYYIFGGHREVGEGGGHHGAGALALHAAMSRAAELGCRVFDFEGSTIPRIEPFVRGFGGALTPYYSVAKAWFPLECALKARYRGYF